MKILPLGDIVFVGFGLPEGPRAAYVLATFSADGNSKYLYNASDGNRYSINDAHCPMLRVGTMVTVDNVSISHIRNTNRNMNF